MIESAKGASYNMFVQFFVRSMTFVLNAFFIRCVTSELLGVVNVRLLLLHSTIVFVAREGFRRVCLSKASKEDWSQVINLIWCIVPIGCVCAAFFSWVWLYLLEQPNPTAIPYYNVGVVCFACCAVLEMTSEPVFITSQVYLFMKLKVSVDSFSFIIGSLVNVILIVIFPQYGIITFSVARIVYTLALVSFYYGYFIWYLGTIQKKQDDFPIKSIRDFFPKIHQGKTWINYTLAKLTGSFLIQSGLKQILTEGERYVMTMFDVLSFADQGVYDVVNNLGSLAARLVFQPIEESGYLFFSQMLTRGLPIQEQKKETVTLATDVLECLLKVVVLIGLTILTFGYSYSYLALDLYGGKVLSSGTGPTLLRWYCLYVLIIAVNGTTECFVFAAMSKRDVDRYNHKMLAFSVIFLMSSWYLTKQLGSVGFILANCLNMGLRIIHSVYYITRWYHLAHISNPLKGLAPSPVVIVTYIGAFLVTVVSETNFCCSQGISYRLVHIAVGACGLFAVLCSIYISEHRLILFIRDQIESRKKAKSKSE